MRSVINRRITRVVTAALIAISLVLTSVAGAEATGRGDRPAADPTVVRDWNETAVATIVTDAGKANAEAFLWYAFEQAAVYNAVVGITRRYELYRWDVHGPRHASPEAAAAAAAHQVLLTYFPASQARLDAQLAESLARIPDGRAERAGIRYGHRAADHIVRLRADDGRFADVPYDRPPAPGVWRPTPPALAPFLAPWLARVDPLLLRSPRQFRPGPPPALASTRYTAEFEEVRDYGSRTGSVRTRAQTETALFFSDIGIVRFQESLRDLLARRNMDISDSARLLAAVDMSAADAIIVSWDSKLRYAFWRPVTAIALAAEDGNPATAPVPGWEPLVTTPPYPEYTSGLTATVGAISRTLSRLLGGGHVDLNVTSAAAGLPGAPLTRHYEFAADLNRDAIDGRVWSGIHFRTADVVGTAQGTRVGDWAIDHYFHPLHRRR